jgi:hypothetical protein
MLLGAGSAKIKALEPAQLTGKDGHKVCKNYLNLNVDAIFAGWADYYLDNGILPDPRKEMAIGSIGYFIRLAALADPR